MTEFYLYKSRYGGTMLTEKTRKGWDFLVVRMENDNGVTIEEARADGDAYEGSYEDSWLFLDDGGSIRSITLIELP